MGFNGIIMGFNGDYPLVMTNIAIEHGPVEIVDLPIDNGDFPVRYVSLPEGIQLYRDYIRICKMGWMTRNHKKPMVLTLAHMRVIMDHVYFTDMWMEPNMGIMRVSKHEYKAPRHGQNRWPKIGETLNTTILTRNMNETIGFWPASFQFFAKLFPHVGCFNL